MKNNLFLFLFQTLFILVGVGALGACSGLKTQMASPAKVDKEASHKCSEPGVLELSPDCGVLIKLKSGLKYQVTKIEDVDFSFTPGGHVWVTLVREDDVLPSCEKVEAAVKVTCVEEIPALDTLGEQDCIHTKDVLQVAWMNQIISKYNPSIVSMYREGPASVYSFEGKFGKVLYDCRGQLLCRTDYGDKTACDKLIKQMGEKEVLLKIDY